jgi:hypothetical protein
MIKRYLRYHPEVVRDTKSAEIKNGLNSMRFLIMSLTGFVDIEIKPNFYDACARKVFPKHAIQSTFLPDPRQMKIFRYLKKLWIGDKVAELLSTTWWAIHNRKNFDVILGWHGSGDLLAIAGALFRWRKPRICLIYYRLYDPNSPKWLIFLKRFLLKFASKGCALLLSVDQKQAALFERELGRAPGTTSSFRYGIDYEWFEHYLKNFGNFPKQNTIFCPGSAYRDDTTLFNAISEMEVEVRRFKLSLESKRVASNSRRIGKANIVNMYNRPYAEYVPACLESTAVVISLNNNDVPAGLTALLECMALGRPIIITRGLSTNNYCIDGVTALEYDKGDSVQLRRQISKLLENPELAEKIAMTAHETLKREYNLDRCGTALAKLLWQSTKIE